MKAKELAEKLNKLIELKPDANVYLYVDEEMIQVIGNRLIKEKNRLSDIDLVLSRSYEGGEGLISVLE